VSWWRRLSASTTNCASGQEVHLEVGHARVDERARDPEAGAEREHTLLELAPREPLGLVDIEQPAKTPGAVARRMRLDDALHSREIEETQPFRRLDRPFRGLRREHLGQVEQRARGRRQREAVVGGHLKRLDRHPMHTKAGARTAPGVGTDRDVEARARIGTQAPRPSRGAVAEDRAVAEREHGGDPPPVNADGEMAHDVDPAVQLVQRTPS
jgi:hypothetical protein